MNHRLKCKHKTIKCLAKILGENLWDLGLSKKFLDCAPQAQPIEVKPEQLDFKINFFFCMKGHD